MFKGYDFGDGAGQEGEEGKEFEPRLHRVASEEERAARKRAASILLAAGAPFHLIEEIVAKEFNVVDLAVNILQTDGAQTLNLSLDRNISLLKKSSAIRQDDTFFEKIL